MGYFDSSKNRALWEIRLGELRKERAAREAGGGRPLKDEPEKQVQDPSRVRITYKELLAMEAKAAPRPQKRAGRAIERQAEPEREKEASAYEKSS